MDFDQIAELRNKAYAAFCSSYQTENPPPERKEAQKENEKESWVMGIIMLSSVTVSGMRTFAEFSDSPLGVLGGAAGLVMLEATLISYAYMRKAKFYTNETHQNVKSMLTKGAYLAFAVTLITNTHVTFKDAGVVFPEPFDWLVNTGIFLMLALGAPTLAFIAGDVLAMLVTTDRYRQKQADKEYEEAARVHREHMNAQWKVDARKWGVTVQRIHVERPEVVQVSSPIVSNSIPSHSNGIPLENKALPSASTVGHRKAPDAAERVRKYYTENPNALELSPLEVSQLLGIGKSTVYNIRNEMRNGKQ